MLHFGSFKGLLRLTSLLILKEVGSKNRLMATSHIEGLFCTLGRGGGGWATIKIPSVMQHFINNIRNC